MAFGIVVTISFSIIGVGMGHAMGFSVGGTAILTTLLASSPYIAVQAAIRISVPEANPTLSITASLGITFPFSILIGIPLYYRFSEKAFAVLGVN